MVRPRSLNDADVGFPRFSACIRAQTFRRGESNLENNRSTKSYCASPSPIFLASFLTLYISRSIRTILDALKDEYETSGVPPPTPTESSMRSPARNLRRIRLGLSPLFFIETNLMKILSPDIGDARELCVRAGSGWKELLGHRGKKSANGQESNGRPPSHTVINNENDPTNVLSAQKGDVIALWEDQTVQDILRKRGIRLEDQPGL